MLESFGVSPTAEMPAHRTRSGGDRMSRTTLALTFPALLLGLAVAGGSTSQEEVESALRDRAKAAWSDGDWDAAAVVVSIGEDELFSSATGKAGDPARKATIDTPLHAAPLAHAFLSSLVVRRASFVVRSASRVALVCLRHNIVFAIFSICVIYARSFACLNQISFVHTKAEE